MSERERRNVFEWLQTVADKGAIDSRTHVAALDMEDVNSILAEITRLRELTEWRPRNRNEARLAFFTHDYDEACGHMYYFGPSKVAAPPYTTQREVKAIIDIADDGTLAGVELISGMPPPPKEKT